MKIEAYFPVIRRVVESSAIVRLSDITYEKRGTYEGVVRGRLQFVDDTVLELREYVGVETKEERLMYVYQYMDSSNNLVFRYDNTGHHRRLGLFTYPPHKHEGNESNVVPSDAKDLPGELEEIELIAKLP